MKNYEKPWYDNVISQQNVSVRQVVNRNSVDQKFMEQRLPTQIDLESPKGIYKYLDDNVYGHVECKKKLSMFLWHMMQAQKKGGRKGGKAILLMGNSGTGKTEIFRVLSKVYSNMFIANGASMTPQGYKGETKLYSGLKNLDCTAKNRPAILVIDEWDKVVASNDNWERSSLLQAEALKMMEGTKINIGTDEKPNYIETSNVNFVFMGAFTELLKSEQVKTMGFGAVSQEAPVRKEITRQTLLDYGITPEFLGRIQNFSVLDDLDETDYCRIILDNRYSPVTRLSREFGIAVEVSEARRKNIAKTAFESGQGVRSMYNQLIEKIDELLFEDCDMKQVSID